jgi:hypothetical protein
LARCCAIPNIAKQRIVAFATIDDIITALARDKVLAVERIDGVVQVAPP